MRVSIAADYEKKELCGTLPLAYSNSKSHKHTQWQWFLSSSRVWICVGAAGTGEQRGAGGSFRSSAWTPPPRGPGRWTTQELQAIATQIQMCISCLQGEFLSSKYTERFKYRIKLPYQITQEFVMGFIKSKYDECFWYRIKTPISNNSKVYNGVLLWKL